jgi:FixJ family two-component response regulator
MPQSLENEEAEKVFVIDDDASVRRALTRLFRAAGRHAEAFASPREFLERLPCPGIGCIVLDINMPDMTGPELHDLMTTRGIALPVVFLTGHGDVPTSVAAMKKGAVDFLLKPVDDEVLLRTVNDAIARHAAGNAQHEARLTITGRLSRLSSREREVMHHVIGGRLNKQIAADLGISLKTVKTHRGRVMAKMEYASVAELVRACEFAGIKPPQSAASRRLPASQTQAAAPTPDTMPVAC